MAMNASRTALETTGHNISNANTNGFHRQRVELESNTPYNLERYVIGRGVNIASIQRMVDSFAEDNYRESKSKYAFYNQKYASLNHLEFILNEMTEDDLSSRMNTFFNSIQDFVNNVEDQSTRVSMVEEGQVLTEEINRLNDEIVNLIADADQEVEYVVEDINTILSEIAQLNSSIVKGEAGGNEAKMANDLRDARDKLLNDLSDIMDTEIFIQPDGTATVSTKGSYLVFGDQAFRIKTEVVDEDKLGRKNLVFEDTGNDVRLTGGSLGALIALKDTILEGYRNELDELSASMIFEFNKIHSTGRGTIPLDSVQSEMTLVSPSTTELDNIDLGFTPMGNTFQIQNGSFVINVENKESGEISSTRIDIDLDGIGGDDTTVDDLVAMLDDVAHISASLTAEGRIQIDSSNNNYGFYFTDDSSNTLATFGINGFFTGINAATMDVNDDLQATPALITGSLSTAEGDNLNALRMGDLRNSKVMTSGTQSLENYYQSIIGRLGVETSQALKLKDSNSELVESFYTRKEETGGVSLDEEAANLLKYQHVFQAAARYITTINAMLQTLIDKV